MELEEQFEQASNEVLRLPKKPSNEILLKIYSLYKQATLGDSPKEKPLGRNFVKIAKFNAWKKQKGKSSKECMQAYIDLINSLKR